MSPARTSGTLQTMTGHDSRAMSFQPAVTGLLLANLVVIGAAIASLLVARRAWDLREAALVALAEARVRPGSGAASRPEAAAPSSAVTGNPVPANVRAPLGKLRAATMDRILLWGSLGAVGSAFFAWRLIARSRALVHSSSRTNRRRH